VAPRVSLQEDEADEAVWLSLDELAAALDQPMGGLRGSKPSACAPDRAMRDKGVLLDELCGIYPRLRTGTTDGGMPCGIGQGHLFILEQHLRSQQHRGNSAPVASL
jgi:hypothetical protein